MISTLIFIMTVRFGCTVAKEREKERGKERELERMEEILG